MEMEKKQIMAFLQLFEKMMLAMLNAHDERTIASLGKMEATDFKVKPEEMQSVMEHQRSLLKMPQ
jgi:hypothetical protein